MKGGVPIDLQVIRVLLISGALLLAGVVSSKLASRLGVPTLVLFILLGMVLGSDIGGLIYFDDAWLAQLVGTLALVIILLEGGLHTKWSLFRRVLAPAGALATGGVLVTVALTGVIARLALGLDWPMALLIGAIVGSTDAAAVFAVIGRQNLPQRLKSTVEAESGMNDPMAVILTLLMMDWVRVGPPNLFAALGFLVWQMGTGLGLGLLAGWLGAKGLGRLRMDASGLYPIMLFAWATFVFALTSWVNGSGFVAVYVMAVYVGMKEIPYKQSSLRFHEGLATLAQMVMFILLGLLVFPRQLPPVALPGLAVAAGLMLVARPAAVWLCTIKMGFSVKERIMLAWAGLRGAVPIILATYPMLAGIAGSNLIFNLVFFVVLTSTLIQGASISWVADKLGLVQGKRPLKAVTLELVAMDRLDTDMIEIVLPEGGEAVGKRLIDLHLPEQATVSALLREGHVVTPRGGTRLQAGDTLFVLADKEFTPLIHRILGEAE